MWYKDGEYTANPQIPDVANAHRRHYLQAGWIPVEDHRPESVEPYERLVLDTEATVDGVRHRHYKAERRPDAEIEEMRRQEYIDRADPVLIAVLAYEREAQILRAAKDDAGAEEALVKRDALQTDWSAVRRAIRSEYSNGGTER